MAQSPGPKSRLLPPTTPKSRNAEIFLSPSPKLKSPSIQKDNGKPIREISNGLKARLNYAFVKLQNGWVDKTLPELENELKSDKKHGAEYKSDEEVSNAGPGLTGAFLKRSSYSNEFLNTQDDSPLKQGFGAIEEDDSSNSAHIAFLKALSSPKKKTKQEPPASPLQWSQQKGSSNMPKKEKDQPPEVEAIETLMSLSSPQRPRSNQEFSLPAPPKRPGLSAQVISPASSASSPSSDSTQTSKSATGTELDSHRLAMPIMQKQSSESSAESLEKSLHADKEVPLEYDQQQTDIETDVEVSDD